MGLAAALALSLMTACRSNDSDSKALCGNGAIDAGEACDGSNLGGQTCQSQGVGPGTLSCNSSCRFDTAQCSLCGNGAVDATEAISAARRAVYEGILREISSARLHASGIPEDAKMRWKSPPAGLTRARVFPITRFDAGETTALGNWGMARRRSVLRRFRCCRNLRVCPLAKERTGIGAAHSNPCVKARGPAPALANGGLPLHAWDGRTGGCG